MLKIAEDKKIINFKQRHEEFTEWLEQVKQNNFSDASNVDSALLIWLTKDEKGALKPYHAHFRMPKVDDFEYIQHCLANYVLNWKFENYLKDNIGNFLEYVND